MSEANPAGAPSVLDFRGVGVSIAGVPILREVSFALRPAETVALIGRNGAGKTTTLRTIMGFTRPSGEIAFDGGPLGKVAAHARPGLGIGYAPEDRRLFTAFTVEENVTLPARIAGLPAETVAERLAEVHAILPELVEMGPRPAGSVSGGQGKMVALGRALMIGTRLVLLDEPFQGLAPALARRYAEALRALRESRPGLTLMITESNPALLEPLVDRALVIERGAVEEGRIDQMQEAP